jgi:hypothetical protein
VNKETTEENDEISDGINETVPGGRRLGERLRNKGEEYAQKSGSRDYKKNKEHLPPKLIPPSLDVNAFHPLGTLENLSGY